MRINNIFDEAELERGEIMREREIERELAEREAAEAKRVIDEAKQAYRPRHVWNVGGYAVGVDALSVSWYTGAELDENGKIKLTPELVEVLTECGIEVEAV